MLNLVINYINFIYSGKHFILRFLIDWLHQTYLGAIRCLKCPVGYYLPVDPLDESSEWICDACSNKVPPNYASHVNAEIGKSSLRMSIWKTLKCITQNFKTLFSALCYFFKWAHYCLWMYLELLGYLFLNISMWFHKLSYASRVQTVNHSFVR